ncbi:Protein of unknown function [Noviherbaspirillum humi]|uniref:Uncharacterized protein n=1 Tax=Noviherbaspirillum humi TaxID=1688639 RepID=A0A239E1Q7_9BURK|nr:DUF2946 family protein [Noviherbaspirillum humi]SNS38626.1 Protein of unknown function [Noviherbaspirillum humi]
MDEIVRQAMAKWPNVPHCFGWLALDARGAWRMRDDRAQALNLPGDRIMNAALQGFINRNYTHDGAGRWYFQNGPQRVYVNLEATPFIARTDPARGFLLQTGAALEKVDTACITEKGELVLVAGDRTAQLDDRDMAQVLPLLRLDGVAVSDEQLLAWVENAASTARMSLALPAGAVPVEKVASDELPRRFGYTRIPSPDAG